MGLKPTNLKAYLLNAETVERASGGGVGSFPGPPGHGIIPFRQRSLGYGEGAGKFQFDTQPPFIIKDLPEVLETTNGRLDLVGEVTDNFVRGGAVTLATRAVEDVARLGKLLLSPNELET